MSADHLVVDAVMRFARECQIAAGHCTPPTDAVRILPAAWRALVAPPPVLPDPAITRRVFCAVLELARHVLQAQSNTIVDTGYATSGAEDYETAAKSLNLLFRCHLEATNGSRRRSKGG